SWETRRASSARTSSKTLGSGLSSACHNCCSNAVISDWVGMLTFSPWFVNPILFGRLEEFDRIAFGVFKLNLLAARSDRHGIAKMQTGLLERLNTIREICHPEHDPVPTARLLTTAVGHGARTRSTWPAQDQFEVVDGHLGERRQILPIQREAEMRRVKRGGTAHVLDLIPYSPKAQDETFVLRSRGIFIG